MQASKQCKNCNLIKLLDEFTIQPRNKDCRETHCKICKKLVRQQKYQTNREIILTQQKIYYQKNKQQKIEYQIQYNVKNQAKIASYLKDYNILNKDIIREQTNIRKKERHKTDIVFKLRELVSGHVYKGLKTNNVSKSLDSSWNYLSYSPDTLKKHIESQFTYWMNWNNHGTYSNKNWKVKDATTWKWQIDHIIPHSKLPYDSMHHINFQICWSLKNLRPLIATQNTKDGARNINYELLKEILLDLKLQSKFSTIDIEYEINKFK